MAWSYNAAGLATTPKDQVRLLVGDTIQANPLLQDEEISFLLTQAASTTLAAADAADAIAASYSVQADRAVGDMRLQASQRAKAFADLAVRLRARGRANIPLPYAGGISQADKQSEQQNTDWVAPAFVVGMMENPGSPNPTWLQDADDDAD